MTGRAVAKVERKGTVAEYIEPSLALIDQLAVYAAVEEELRGGVTEDAAQRGPAFQAWRDAATLYERTTVDAAKLGLDERRVRINEVQLHQLAAKAEATMNDWLTTITPHLADPADLPAITRKLRQILTTHLRTPPD